MGRLTCAQLMRIHDTVIGCCTCPHTLQAHANKKGVFSYGNALEGEAAVQSLLYSRLIALNNPMFDFQSCNFTEKNMTRADKVCRAWWLASGGFYAACAQMLYRCAAAWW